MQNRKLRYFCGTGYVRNQQMYCQITFHACCVPSSSSNTCFGQIEKIKGLRLPRRAHNARCRPKLNPSCCLWLLQRECHHARDDASSPQKPQSLPRRSLGAVRDACSCFAKCLTPAQTRLCMHHVYMSAPAGTREVCTPRKHQSDFYGMQSHGKAGASHAARISGTARGGAVSAADSAPGAAAGRRGRRRRQWRLYWRLWSGRSMAAPVSGIAE